MVVNATVLAALPSGMIRCTLYRRQVRTGEDNLVPPGIDPRTVQPIASRYTHSAIPITTTTTAASGWAPRRRLHLDHFRSLIQPSASNASNSRCSEAVTKPSTNLLTTKYRPALRPTQLPIQQVPVILGVKWPDREADGSDHPQWMMQNAKDSPYVCMPHCIRHRDDLGASSGSGLGSGGGASITFTNSFFYIPLSVVPKLCTADPRGSVDKFL